MSFPRRAHPFRIATLVVAFLLVYFINSLWRDSSAGSTTAVGTVARASNKQSDPRIAIVTFITDEKSYIHMSLKNKHAYAKKHNYDLIIDYEGQEGIRGLMWHKFIMAERVIRAGQHDWVWWIDFDTLITNGQIKVADIIHESLANETAPNEIDLLLTADCFFLNAGSMLMRSSPGTLDFIDRVRAYGEANHDLSEQDCMRDVIQADQAKTKESGGKEVGYASRHVRFIPQWKINAFPEEIRCWDSADRGWEPGVFLVHFAGAWAHLKEEDPTGFLMRKYEPYISGF